MNSYDKAWDGIFEFPLCGRVNKQNSSSRNSGLTMVIDKGLSLQETEALLSVTADYLDLVKFGFGTSAFYTYDFLKQKIQLIQQYNVEPYPGGTFLEVAIMQRKLLPFLSKAKELGFKFIEVSDGTINLSDEVRKDVISTAIKMGFVVITEVGKKNPQDKINRTKIIQQINSDIAAGAWKVIVEGRESGKGVGVYNSNGDIDEKSLEDIVDGLTQLDNLIWESPLKSQQQALIERFGINVNLGNIPVNEVLSLEALRVGLRGDTLRQVVKSTTDHSYSFQLPSQAALK
ncbi:MAG: phosphosulfolactate synthase [Bacillota bacterium]|nr:phosphosulfolactate synthase [Bacillota bacterium]